MRDRAGLKKIARVLLPVAAAAFAVSFFTRNRLPGPELILDDLKQEPAQTAEGLPEPFDVARKNVTYTVTPLAAYELWGLVVSYHHSASFVDISHKQWNDFLNTKDICVIWGTNIETGVYKRMTFRNRDFTCYFTYPDRETGELFAERCLSNNHLLPSGPLVADAVLAARKGDQIHLKGWLVSYGIRGTPYARRSSLSRLDRGNGACEVVYVDEFEVLKPANRAWRTLSKLSLAAGVFSLAALIFL